MSFRIVRAQAHGFFVVPLRGVQVALDVKQGREVVVGFGIVGPDSQCLAIVFPRPPGLAGVFEQNRVVVMRFA